MKLITHWIALLCVGTLAWETVAEELPIKREWKVGGTTRIALVHVPGNEKKSTNASPVVFAFHGHGGRMQNAARTFRLHLLWPEAIVVYPQGLNTQGHLTDPEGKRSGWQRSAGDQQDRDLKFVDTMLASLKQEYRIDTNRVFATGHSNGGAFTYLLRETRSESFTAFAPSAALLPLSARTQGHDADPLLKKPILHIAGENDTLVKYDWQKLFLEGLRRHNGSADGKPWNPDSRCTIYSSKKGSDIITYIHGGTHKFPEEAPEIIVKFFKRL